LLDSLRGKGREEEERELVQIREERAVEEEELGDEVERASKGKEEGGWGGM